MFASVDRLSRQSQMVSNKRSLIAAAMVCFVCGCAAKKAETLSVDSAPTATAVSSTSVFRPSLACLDLQLAARGSRTTDIVVGLMPDATNELSIGLRDMTMNAVGRATARSGAFRVIDVAVIEPVLGKDATPLKVGPDPNLDPTSLHLSGSIVAISKTEYSEGADAGIGLQQGRVGISYVGQLGSVTTSMRVSRFGTREQLYNEQHELVLRDRQIGLDLVAEIGTFAGGGGLQFDRRESPARAVQTLVDLHVIELLGKAAGVPYWECLNQAGTNPTVSAELSDEWQGLDQTARQGRLQSGLTTLGYRGDFRSALTQFQVDNALLATGRPSFETYRMMSLALPGGIPKNAPDGPAQGVNALVLKVSKISPTIRLEIGLVRSANVYCFQQDNSDGSIAQIFPNPFQKDSRLTSNALHFVPNTIAEKSMAIKGDSLSFLCLGTAEEIVDRLPQAYSASPLSDLRAVGVTSFSQIFEHFSQSYEGEVLAATAEYPSL